MVKYRGLAYFKGLLVKTDKKCLKIIFSWRKEDPNISIKLALLRHENPNTDLTTEAKPR